MPSGQYIASREPPSLLDRVLANPFLIPFSVIGVGIGLLVLLSAFTRIEVSRSLSELPDIASVTVAAPLLVGAPVSAAGALHLMPSWSRLKAMSIERWGDLALSAGWLAYGASVALSGNHLAIATAGIGLTLGIGYALRVWGMGLSERRIRRSIEAETLGR